MTKQTSSALSRRERQIMDILYRRGRATAAEVNQDEVMALARGRVSGSGIASSSRPASPCEGLPIPSSVPR